MPEKETAPASFKAAFIQWVLANFSFPLIMLCFVLGIGLAILELPYIGPLETNTTLALIALNGVICLLISFYMRFLFERKVKKRPRRK